MNITIDAINLVTLAQKINSANFDSFYAVHSSDIVPLPHQIQAVYHEMLTRSPLRYVLADDPGAGKTIMTGLLIKELFIRSKINSCIIVAPGPLAEQWQDELSEKFHMDFSLLSDDKIPDFCIARLDTLARNKDLQQTVSAKSWDLAVFDEAHKLSAQSYGLKTYYTKRFQLARSFSKNAGSFLLLTATPHNGKARDFHNFMSLLGKNISSASMHRLLKEDLLNFSCSPIFPEREAFTVSYSLSELEASLYEKVTDYVRTQFNRADSLSTRRRNSVGFALTVLQRRLASSPEAICKSLTRRLERLEQKLKDSQLTDDCSKFDSEEDSEDYAATYVSASQTASELRAEIQTLKLLVSSAEEVRHSGQDVKWTQLSRLLQEDSRINSHEKLIIFTEHRDTLHYLAEKIRSLLGNYDSVTEIHGSMSRTARRTSAERFKNNPETQILIATDAAGEGINLQCARLMINYDLPWNPNRLEQRFGRIHRIGQHKTCYLWNIVAENTREGSVFSALLRKLDEERRALGGKVFDVIGRITFGSKSLHELLVDAIRRNSAPNFDGRQIKSILNERALRKTSLSPEIIAQIHSDLQDSESHMLRPEIVKSFILEALPHLGGSIQQRSKNTYEITYVPKEIRRKDSRIKRAYKSIAFEKNFHAEVIIKGHPLLEALVSIILEKHHDLLSGLSTTTKEGRDSIELAAMAAVMNIERGLGNSPRDVSAQKCGYDIESTTPNGTLRKIEVKGRRAGADTITLTAGEIRSAIMNPENFLLAISEVSGDDVHTTYLKHNFTHEPEPEIVSVTFSIKALIDGSVCLYRD